MLPVYQLYYQITKNSKSTNTPEIIYKHSFNLLYSLSIALSISPLFFLFLAMSWLTCFFLCRLWHMYPVVTERGLTAGMVFVDTDASKSVMKRDQSTIGQIRLHWSPQTTAHCWWAGPVGVWCLNELSVCIWWASSAPQAQLLVSGLAMKSVYSMTTPMHLQSMNLLEVYSMHDSNPLWWMYNSIHWLLDSVVLGT